MRIGHGFDAHAFCDGKKLVLGGVEVPHAQGLLAHSDGDVVLHALCDALFGAAGLGDIGQHFPDTDSDYKDIDSRKLLRKAIELITARGLVVGNADLTIVAQTPRLADYIDTMCDTIATDLGIQREQVNIKATTTEGMGFTGRKEGIAAFAVILLEAKSA